MGTPTKRRTSGQRKRRAKQLTMTINHASHCPKCKKPIRPHHACGFCGHYKGREVNKKKTHTATKKTKTKA